MDKAEFSLTPVTGNSFAGRKTFIVQLVEELADKKSHIGFCLYGRRRVGKTSALMEARFLLGKKKDIIVAYFSLYDIIDLSPKTFADELVDTIVTAYQEKGLLSLKMKIRELLRAPAGVVAEFLKSIKVEAKVAEQIKLIFEYKEKEADYSEYLRQAFNMGETLAEATGSKCIIMLDEFPEIIKFENGLQLVKMLRTQYEVQKRTALVISGSIRKTLELVALSVSSPFYKQLVPKHLLPFTEAEVGEFLRLYLGKVDHEEVKQLYGLTGGLPFYLQFIGRSTKYSGKIKDIISTFITQEGDIFFKEEFEKLSEKEKGIITVLSGGTRSLTEIATELSEPATTIGKYLPSLVEMDIVAKESRGTYLLSDNLFGYWIQSKKANK